MADQNTKLSLADVVQFHVLNVDKNKQTLNILLQTQHGFRIYADKLKFKLTPSQSLPYDLNFQPKIKAQKIFDSFYQEEKLIFGNGNEFQVSGITTKLNSNDKVTIDVQACSQNVCMLPTSLSIQTQINAASILPVEELSFQSSTASGLKISSNSAPNSQEKVEKNSPDVAYLNNNLSYFLQNAFKNGSLILFPALFLAGLLMNLTPCVYPMIPITLSVMTQFEKSHATAQEKKRRRIIFPLIYVGAMVIVYSILGVFAGMSGNIFGSQLSSPLFSAFMAAFMFVFAFAMLGLFNLAKVQSFAVRIPLAKNNPALAVATMGAVSGLVSAPCTGPVLSMILVLIAKNKDPFSGFLYMMFFAFGFGAPYVLLGFLSQKIMKMPKFPRGVEFVKLFFAALMFSLGFYFLKSILQNYSALQFLYWKPAAIHVVLFFLVTLVFFVLAKKKNIIGKLCHLGALICLFFLCMWLTLGVTHSFIDNSSTQSVSMEKILKNSPIVWYTKYDEAVALAQKAHKPILVDIWADWCVACIEMEETTWKNNEVVKILNEKYIAVKLDFSSPSESVDALIDRWQVVGLPAVILFKKEANFEGAPSSISQGIISESGLLEKLGGE
ncbi:MAG: cytochrome c biogenesis protein CcdA [Bdellovibrionota bacterium]